MSKLRFWSRWVLANAVAEAVGLGTVFAVGVSFAASRGEPEGRAEVGLLALLVILLAVFEGAVVGGAQWLVLRRKLTALTRGSWVGATVVGAVIAWLLGMIPSTLGAMGEGAAEAAEEPPMAIVLLLAAVMGAVAGVILAIAQWWVLRRHVPRALLWLLANAAAWALAMPLIFQAVGATIAESRTVGSLLLLAVALGVAGALVGTVHGLFLLKLLPWEEGR